MPEHKLSYLSRKFVEMIQMKQDPNNWRPSLRYIYKLFNNLMVAGEFKAIDNTIQELISSQSLYTFTTVNLIGLATVTSWAKKHLVNRPQLFDEIKSILKERPEYTPTILKGLE